MWFKTGIRAVEDEPAIDKIKDPETAEEDPAAEERNPTEEPNWFQLRKLQRCNS